VAVISREETHEMLVCVGASFEFDFPPIFCCKSRYPDSMSTSQVEGSGITFDDDTAECIMVCVRLTRKFGRAFIKWSLLQSVCACGSCDDEVGW